MTTLRHILTAALIMVTSHFSVAADDGQQLDGTWRTVSAYRDTKPLHQAEGATYRFDDGRLSIQLPGKSSATINYRVNAKETPMHLDAFFQGTNGTEVSRMLFGFQGEILMICYPEPGGKRPTNLHKGLRNYRDKTLIYLQRTPEELDRSTTSAEVTQAPLPIDLSGTAIPKDANGVAILEGGRSVLTVEPRFSGRSTTVRVVIRDSRTLRVKREINAGDISASTVRVSRNGPIALLADHHLKRVQIWNVSTGRLLKVIDRPVRDRMFAHTARLEDIAVAPDGSRFFYSSCDSYRAGKLSCYMSVWNLHTMKQLWSRGPHGVYGVAFTHDSQSLLMPGPASTSRQRGRSSRNQLNWLSSLVDPDTGKSIKAITHSKMDYPTAAVLPAPDGKSLVFTNGRGALRRCDLASGRTTAINSEVTVDPFLHSAYSRDGSVLAVYDSREDTTVLLDTATLTEFDRMDDTLPVRDSHYLWINTSDRHELLAVPSAEAGSVTPDAAPAGFFP